ncbi:MAG: AAA family ATPase, partial [Candidatus Hydrogenedentales bacterium]
MQRVALYIQRSLEPVLLKAAKQFPAVVVTGPRQSGKTTLLRHALKDTHRYISLESPDVRATAQHDPRGFLASFAPPVIFDEVHCAPDLLPYVKEHIDAHRDTPGQFILSGSHNLLMMQQNTETLAGRAAVLKLFPLSRREIAGVPDAPLPWEGRGDAKARPG